MSACAVTLALAPGGNDYHRHGGGEILRKPAAGKQPHILLVLFDDYGWADAGWHRNYTAPDGSFVPATPEVQTPHLDSLVKEGINLNRNYVYKYCSPSRSALQSGRNPIHVNPLNAAPDISNPNDPVSGFAGIPRNMTGIATKLAAAGYYTAQFGKWDAGMASADHTPAGRGYARSLAYFHHDNDYWSSAVGSCKLAPPNLRPGTCSAFGFAHKFCLSTSPNLLESSTSSPEDCCSLCASKDACKAWAWGKFSHDGGKNHSCILKKDVKTRIPGNCTSSCNMVTHDYAPMSCKGTDIPVVDLWHKAVDGSENPAWGMNSTCSGMQGNGNCPVNCKPGPDGDANYAGYEDALFEEHVLDTISSHNASQPLFLFYAPHIVHTPLQMPRQFSDKFAFMAATDKPSHNRQYYHSMVNFADAAVKNITDALKAKGMWDDTLVIFSSDNGGPIYGNGSAGASKYFFQ